MKKFFVLIIMVCMIFSVVMEHSYATEQQSNISYVTENREVKFKQVEAGPVHSLGLSVDGTVYSWGDNEFGELGDGTFISKSSPISIMDNVRFIAAANRQSFAITTSNELYAWGLNNDGQLGDGTTITQAKPIKIMENVQSVALGFQHTLILTTNGEVYGVGRNLDGALGQGSADTTITSFIKLFDNICMIAAESTHSMVLTNNGILYHFGRLGDTTIQYQPTIMMENVKDIVCGYYSAFVITNNNELYGWGKTTGYGVLMKNTDSKEPIKLMDNALMLSASEQVLLLDMDHNLITWGQNDCGEIGNGTRILNTNATKIMENISFVESQRNHSLAISSNGELYTWGLNDYGKLGNGLTTGYTLIPTKIQVFGSVPTPRIEFKKSEVIMSLNTITAINATVYNSTSKEATWVSSDPTVATVSDTGEVTAIGIGTAQITMTTGDGITNSCTIIVTQADTPIPEIPL